MKFLIQTSLIGLLILVGFIFYKNYFLIDKSSKIVDGDKTPELIITKPASENQKNIIKNLKYNVELIDSGKYEIKSDLSEVINKNGAEVVMMKKVTAIFTDKKNRKLYIYSDVAEFNSNNYNTSFKKNIQIKFEDNTITSNNLDFNFIKNNILVYDNVIYNGSNGNIQTDNIKINLITKNIEIFMNDKNENIKIISF